ncbi:MAG: Response regulator PleD [Parcubacteria bacterium OLB19]|nr:MAG: Response regulator PleD [Parcubacteria bacterium OLB19]
MIWDNVKTQLELEGSQRQALTDHLTGLLNRRALDLALEKYIANFQRGKRDKINKPFCIILFDLDNFKGINDVFGYNTGDTVLKIVAKIAQSKIRPADFIARYGGEEFVIIFNGEIGDAINLANRIKTSFLEIDVRDLEINPSKHPNITASFGVAQYDEEKTPVFERANTYMKQAKEGGKNMVFY